MPWPLVFIQFLLGSTFRTHEDAVAAPGDGVTSDVHYCRAEALPGDGALSGELHEDAGGPPGDVDAARELYCRMFGVDKEGGPCEELAVQGCGCPVHVPKACTPPFLSDKAKQVGWEETLDESTAITFSFEKEWQGDAPGLHHLYQPAGSEDSPCDALWARLGGTQKAEFMAEFGRKAREEDRALDKYFLPSGPCQLPDKLIALRRSSTELSISGLIEDDFGPWEVKAETFYYDLETMQAQVEKMLPYMGVPPSDSQPDGFPAERRIQVHVVASLHRGADGYGGAPPAQNTALLRNLRLIQLFYSDFIFLRLGFPHGPMGEACRGSDGSRFQCDVFTDDHNSVIDTSTAGGPWGEEPVPVRGNDNKFEIVGIRAGEVYGGAKEIDCSGDCSQPYRVGFEIRKSESFQAALYVAGSISLALQSMKADGSAKVGMRQKHDIETVRRFAEQERMKRRGPKLPICGYYPTFSTRDRRHPPEMVPWLHAVARLAEYFHEEVGRRGHPNPGKKRKLWDMLALLLCSDWTTLVGRVDTRLEAKILTNLNSLQADFSDVEVPKELLETLRKDIAEYAFELSKGF